MSLIPEEELKRNKGLNLAPMVDFLFLIVALFALVAITRSALHDSEIDLVKGATDRKDLPSPAIEENTFVTISINEQGQYKWVTEMDEFILADADSVQEELKKQQEIGLLPEEKLKTKILLHIDRGAKWEPIAQLIFVIKEAGYNISPVYQPNQD